MRQLYNTQLEHSSCGVGFITHKHSLQTHELLQHSHEALCKIPHRGGMSAEGIGDGAGVNIDISLSFFQHLCEKPDLALGEFGVANFFYPIDSQQHQHAKKILEDTFAAHNLDVIKWRTVEVNLSALNDASQQAQLSIQQLVFVRPTDVETQSEFEVGINKALLEIEQSAFNLDELYGFYPLSMSSHTQVYKGRLNSWEVIPYFKDLSHPEHKIHTLFFHTRFSTNTAPNPMFAQPFRRMAHNGELNTDKKNRLSEDAIARSKRKKVVFPKGQSDSARLDQTLARRITEDKMDIVTAVTAMMPPAWENDIDLSQNIEDMLEYYSLSEEKNDGPAALIFFDGVKVGARLDRLGLRPLRTVETNDYFAVMSEAGQIDFGPESVIKRGRIEAGGMVVFNHQNSSIKYSQEILESLAASEDFSALLMDRRIKLSDLPEKSITDVSLTSSLNISARHAAYSMNQESFKFMLDPMLQTGLEKISAMGYGIAPNALTPQEGGMSRYFSQRFAQVTNPPLDSIREADGMTLRVALGPKIEGRQLALNSPILQPQQLLQITEQSDIQVASIDTLFTPDLNCHKQNESNLLSAIDDICSKAEALAKAGTGIIILTDRGVSHGEAAVPAILLISAVNQHLIKHGLRFHCSLVYETGQVASTHDVACLLGFGASAVSPLTVFHRALELANDSAQIKNQLKNFQKAVEKALMKTMGKFGLCTVESYICGEFFESNFFDTKEPILAKYFPNIDSPVGGVRFADIAQNAAKWHEYVHTVQNEKDIPLLGLFKERSDGAGHAFGNTAVREYINMTEEAILYADDEANEIEIDAILPDDIAYKKLGFEALSPEQINSAEITPAYRFFSENLRAERHLRPATLRDVLALTMDFNCAASTQDFVEKIAEANLQGNNNIGQRGLKVVALGENQWQLTLERNPETCHPLLVEALTQYFDEGELAITRCDALHIELNAKGNGHLFCSLLISVPDPIELNDVQPASEITASLASGAMSHGALVAKAHEAVAQGTNIAGAMSNSGEGGEASRRYNTVKASKIKQFASGRFGVWCGYLADPALQEIEIKIAQGAKPGEGGQLPSAKVNVEIAAARGGTPGVELVSPPPHHDTYSIEDLGQLIHDAKAARVKVVVKLVSSEGVGTIAVGVAKAGADVINIAGNTGGTGAAQVTSLKHTGRAADVGIAEVHQALSDNGLRDKVVLRCSNAHQTGLDVIKSAILGGDSFEFGTTALMMLKCVMAKNCNIKCPAGLTTNPELYQGDPRALAQYFINLAHEVREILASIGYTSLQAIRGETKLLNMVNHASMVGQLDLTGMLKEANIVTIEKPVYLEADFVHDDVFLNCFKTDFLDKKASNLVIEATKLNNCNKSVGAQFSIDVERILNYQLSKQEVSNHSSILLMKNGRKVLANDSVTIHTNTSAGQSYGAFNNTGVTLVHSGTCNDGVGKGATGGKIVVKDPYTPNHLSLNVLVGNFSLFGATGGELYVNGQAGDRFGVRNSGAVAVVEGVGDFCCEYMTNGSIVNLGQYGKGFGNGMSGGMAYQYDPSGDIVNRCSKDSVKAFGVDQNDDLSLGQAQALKQHLQAHLEHTGSKLTAELLANWEQEKKHFYYVVPLSLLQYQRSENIAKLMTRKAMLDELSQAIAFRLIRDIQTGYHNMLTNTSSMFNGQVPAYGECDSPLIFQFVSAIGVLRRAFEQATKVQPDDADNAARKLIETEDKKLVDVVSKDTKEVLNHYCDDALSALLADKRLTDYKQSLQMREVWDTQAFGVSVWILNRDQQNTLELAEHLDINEALARHYHQLLTDVIRQQLASA